MRLLRIVLVIILSILAVNYIRSNNQQPTTITPPFKNNKIETAVNEKVLGISDKAKSIIIDKFAGQLSDQEKQKIINNLKSKLSEEVNRTSEEQFRKLKKQFCQDIIDQELKDKGVQQ